MENVHKYFELSTGHLSAATAERIDLGTFEKLPVYRNDYSWVFSVPQSISELVEQGVSDADFLAVMAVAASHDCNYVLFDQDANFVPYLEAYDW